MKGFEFKQCITILKSTGRKARDVRQLLDCIEKVSPASIFHHTYQYFLKGHIFEYTNDFAQWAALNIEERELSEQLSNIDPYAFKGVEELRAELASVINRYLDRYPEPREAMPGREFYFNEPLTVIYPAGIKVSNLAEFLIAIKYVDESSIYYHFYEARIRTGRDDFSSWIEEALGKPGLVEGIRAIDPFMHSIDGIRAVLSERLEAEVKNDMQAVEVAQ